MKKKYTTPTLHAVRLTAASPLLSMSLDSGTETETQFAPRNDSFGED